MHTLPSCLIQAGPTTISEADVKIIKLCNLEGACVSNSLDRSLCELTTVVLQIGKR